MNKKNTGNLFLLVAILLTITACGGAKKAAKKQKAKQTDNSVAAVVVRPSDSATPITALENPNMDRQIAGAFSPVWQREISFRSFSGKAKSHYEGNGQSYDFTAHIRMKKDEAAWIMVAALGGMVQVARLYATPDSFALINYLEKSYLSMKMEEGNRVLPFPVNFSMLQNLLIGNALQTSGKLIDAKNTGDAATLTVKNNNLNQDVIINKSANTISLVKVYLDNNPSEAIVKYNNYKDLEGKKFPVERIVHVSNKGEQHLLEMNFTETKFNGAVDMPFSIPKNYNSK